VVESAPAEPSDSIRRRGPPPSAAQRPLARNAVPGPADLDRLPALPVLDRLPVPVLAIQNRGAILFANHALAELLGLQKISMSEMTVWQILEGLPRDPCVHHYLHAHAGQVVGLIPAQGSIIKAHMSASALRRYDDQVVLSAFVPLRAEIRGA
jgi:transcriptional regulator of aromatic amino acid metabolism